MSHVDQGPLPAYNSLTDNNLTGYFASTRMRSHLRRSGLITRRGEIVSENTYRLNMSRKEHKKHVKDMLAQAIVHKTLDLERSRQAEIRKKLEEIAKIELVRRVKNDRHKTDENILPHLAPKSPKGKAKRTGKSPSAQNRASSSSRGSQNKKGSHEPKKNDSIVHERDSRDKKRENYVLPLVSPRRDSSCQDSMTSASSSRPATTRRRRATRSAGGSPSRRGRRPISALSSNYDDDNETVVYLDDEGRPISPSHIDRNETKYSSKDPIDTRHLYSLDTAALRKYAMLMAKMEQGRGGLNSPYLIPQVPLPPKSPRSGRAPLSANRHRSDSDAKKYSSPKRPATASQAYLHPAGPPKQVRGQMETMCEVFMEYHGSSLSLVREQFDKRQDVIVEQQHCGGNTLTVFRDKMEAGTKFSFISYRHRGYPFSLSIYIDGKIDCRVSVCCEHRHSKGGRIGGKKGHFSICSISGVIPCYKCQVEKGIRVKSAAPRRKLKRPPQPMEEVTVVQTHQDKEEVDEEPEPAEDRSGGEEILVPVDDDDAEQPKSEPAEYDEDFDSSESEEEGYICNDTFNNERGSDEDDDDDDDDDYDDDDFDDDDDDDDGDDGSKARVIKDAANVIRAANRLIEESAISAEKEKKYLLKGGGRDEDGRGQRTKDQKTKGKTRRGKTDDRVGDDDDVEDDDEDEDDERNRGTKKSNYSSISSMGEDEDYYAYKERMMKKLEEQEKKIKKNKRKSDAKTKKSDSKSDVREEEDFPRKQQVDKNGKKLSSTSSALGQAEPVETGSGERGNRKSKSGGKRGGTRGHNNEYDDGSGSDVRDTADEVSDIESEMAAASPRKSGSVTNLDGPQLSPNSKTSSSAKGQQNSAEGEGKAVDKIEHNGKQQEEETGVADGTKKNEILSAGVKGKAKRKQINDKENAIVTKVIYEKGDDSKKAMATEVVSVVGKGENVEDVADGDGNECDKAGQKFHIDVYPKDSVVRAEGDFDENPKPDEDNDRGVTKEERKSKRSKRSDERSGRRDGGGDSDDVVDTRRGNNDKWGKKNPDDTTLTGKKSESCRKSSGRNKTKRPKEGITHAHTPTVEVEKYKYVDGGAGFVGKEDDADRNVMGSSRTSPRNKGSHFESETTAFPMMKTGQNPYLKAQEKENEAVKLRAKSDSFSKRIEDGDKRKGKYFRDLSPETKIIRGFVGDDGSEGDEAEDETYSKLNLLDGRANTSDSEMDTLGDKDYVLSNQKQPRRPGALRRHCTFDMSHQNFPREDSEAEDRPNYRVLVHVGRDRDRQKSKIRAIKRQKKVEEVKEQKIRIVEDTRGVGDSDDDVVRSTNDDRTDIEVRVHHPQHNNGMQHGHTTNHHNNSNSNVERFHRKQGQDNVHNHYHNFSEEPPLTTNTPGSRDAPIQATPVERTPENQNNYDNDDDFVYSTDEDHSGDNDDGDFNENEDAQFKENGNPETWYRVPEAANMAMSEAFLGATEEIHRSKYVHDEDQRYAKHQLAFKASPDVDNETMKAMGGVVSVLTTKPRDEVDVPSGGPAIASFSVKKQGEIHDASNTTVTTHSVDDVRSSNKKTNGRVEPDFQINDKETVRDTRLGENGREERVVQSSKTSSNLDWIEGEDKSMKQSCQMGNGEYENRNMNTVGGYGEDRPLVQPVKENSTTSKEDGGEMSDVDEKQLEDGRRDSNYMADLSSGSLSESCGTTQSSSRTTEGRNVRKKKRRDRKKAEYNGFGVVRNSAGVGSDQDCVESSCSKKERGEKDGDLRLTSKGRVAELQSEDRKFSSGSIPEVIITSADESGEGKVNDVNDDDENMDVGVGEKGTKCSDEKSKTEVLVDDSVGVDMKECKSSAIDSTKRDGMIGETVDVAKDSSNLANVKSNGKKVVLELQNALCEDESSADDVSGIDALIEVLEDQLADTTSQKSTGRKKMTITPSEENSVASSSHKSYDRSSNGPESSDNINKTGFSTTVPVDPEGDKDEHTSEIQTTSKANIADDGLSTIAYKNPADEVETLISMNNANASDDDEPVKKEETKKETVTEHDPKSKDKSQTSVDADGNTSQSQSDSIEYLDHQAELIVSQMMASITNMASLNPDMLKEPSSSPQTPNNDNSDNTNLVNNEVIETNPKLQEDTRIESEITDLLLRAGEIENEMEQVPSVNESMADSTPSTPSGRKSSLTIKQGLAYIERRRQRKLTVSFAVDEGSDGNTNGNRDRKISEEGGDEEDDDFYSWEEAADSEKEEEYEKLERELERSLCGKKK